MNDLLLLPIDDTNLANLLSIWGYELDEKQRVFLHRPGGLGVSHTDATCSMSYVRGLLGEKPTVRDLRECLAARFAPARALDKLRRVAPAL